MGSSTTIAFEIITNTGGSGGSGGGGGGSGAGDSDDSDDTEPIDKQPTPTVVEEGETANVGDVATTKYVQVASGGSVEFTFNA